MKHGLRRGRGRRARQRAWLPGFPVDLAFPVGAPGGVSALAAALAAVAVLACAAPDPGQEPDGAGDMEEGTIDWAARAVSLDAGDWIVEFCEGDGPFLCVTRDGRHAGAVELLRWPMDSHEALRRALASGVEASAALAATAADLTATVAADRRVGCGADYQVRGDTPIPIRSGGAPGIRSGFRGVMDGRVVERVVHYRFVARDTLFVLAAAAYAPDGCLSGEGDFSVSDLAALEPVLDRVARASRFGEAGGL